MFIMNAIENRNFSPIRQGLAMHKPAILMLIDDLIEDYARRDSEGWHLSIDDLSYSERRELRSLNNTNKSDQDVINERCYDLYSNYIETHGFSE